MNWNNIFHDCSRVLPLIFAFASSFMLVRNKLKFSAENTIMLWTLAADEVMRKNISSEHANAIVGFVFLLISIILQIVNLSLQITWESFRRFEETSILVALAILCLLLLIGELTSKNLKQKFLRQIEEREAWWGKEKKDA